MMIEVLYRDKTLMLCVKPVGMLSEASPGGGDVITDAVMKDYGLGYAGLVHRLDCMTGGIILLSLDRKYTGVLSELVGNREYHKEYLAVTDGIPSGGELRDYLFFDRRTSKSYIAGSERKGVKEAILDYTPIASVQAAGGKDKTLIRVILHTGRTHQIRVQLSARGFPLTGDGKYGSRDNGCHTALWSYRAEFIHPVYGTRVSAVSYPPDEYPWNLFNIENILDDQKG